MSHPSWVCGLKQLANDVDFASQIVTPFVGVWIETLASLCAPQCLACHTLRGCVDWNELSDRLISYLGRHTLRGCVDWNLGYRSPCWYDRCHTLRGCVDWNKPIIIGLMNIKSHTLRGCVDWNFGLFTFSVIKSSHTLRGCVDWNFIRYVCEYLIYRSHPSWVCGLKLLKLWCM